MPVLRRIPSLSSLSCVQKSIHEFIIRSVHFQSVWPISMQSGSPTFLFAPFSILGHVLGAVCYLKLISGRRSPEAVRSPLDKDLEWTGVFHWMCFQRSICWTEFVYIFLCGLILWQWNDTLSGSLHRCIALAAAAATGENSDSRAVIVTAAVWCGRVSTQITSELELRHLLRA